MSLMAGSMEINSIKILNEGQVKETTGTLSREDDLKLKEACCEFEQIFIKYLVDSMWASVESMSEGFSNERAIWQDMLNNEIAKEISRDSGLGISDAIYRQISSACMIESKENLD